MRVLHVSAHDLHGGAGLAAYRLHMALKAYGIDSHMLVQHQRSADPDVTSSLGTLSPLMGKIRPRGDRLPLRIYSKRPAGFFSPSWFPGRSAISEINRQSADIVHLHWIADGMIRLDHLAEIRKPVVWTFHDMWALTGGCHYDLECGKFLTGCGSCPQLGSSRETDTSRRGYLRREEVYRSLPLARVVTPSAWLAGLVQESPLFAGFPVISLPNPVEVDAFAPIDRETARSALSLSPDADVLAFGAMDTRNPIKGMDLLMGALRHLPSDLDLTLLTFGASSATEVHELPFRHVELGRLRSEEEMKLVYNAASVVAVPSLQDNLPQVATEALSCGTPIVGFRVGGLPEIAQHKVTGYLADPFDVKDLANGVLWALNTDSPTIRRDARAHALERYSPSTIASLFEELYIDVANDGTLRADPMTS